MRRLDGIISLMDMSEQTLGDSEGQGSLACCGPWGHKESGTIKHNNRIDLIWSLEIYFILFY